MKCIRVDRFNSKFLSFDVNMLGSLICESANINASGNHSIKQDWPIGFKMLMPMSGNLVWEFLEA